jgi:hypothetical protein
MSVKPKMNDRRKRPPSGAADVTQNEHVKHLKIEQPTASGGKFKLEILELNLEWNDEEGREAALDAFSSVLKQMTGGDKIAPE